MKQIQHILFLSILFVAVACGMTAGTPEERLLAVFQEELAEIKAGASGSYADYMENRDRNFVNHQAKVNALINEINAKFDSMTVGDQQEYQSAWRASFQPVVGEIYTRMREFVVRETRELTPDKMARIKTLSIRHKALEKAAPRVMLKPQFFVLPEENP